MELSSLQRPQVNNKKRSLNVWYYDQVNGLVRIKLPEYEFSGQSRGNRKPEPRTERCKPRFYGVMDDTW